MSNYFHWYDCNKSLIYLIIKIKKWLKNNFHLVEKLPITKNVILSNEILQKSVTKNGQKREKLDPSI